MARPVFARIRTRRDMQRRLMALVGIIGASHFIVDIPSDYLPRELLNMVRLMAVIGIGFASAVFEMYKGRRGA